MTSSEQQKSSPNPFPLESPNKFAWIIRVKPHELQEVAAVAESLYNPYFEKKKGKKPRLIHNPSDRLKIIQKKINTWILQKYPFPDFIVGGIKGKALEDHFKLHLRKDIVVTLDIKNCFPSITNKHIYDVFKDKLGALSDTARLATLLTAYKGQLPVGAPTSPLLANLVLLPVLIEIKKLVNSHGFEMSQFIDDSAFSGKRLPVELVSEVCKMMARAGFTISHKKTLVMPKSDSQTVTKRIVNQTPGIPRKEMNRIRSAVNELKNTPKNDPLYGKRLASVKGRVISIRKFYPQVAEKFLQEIGG
ncbi:MAG: RNA-directed DNA polymerase [Candidatus Omnitrophica bacterium]|nr:RNA-directed DNA polymerase [Candidatus Omnitrophota bacterium]